jgi:hypothetical protein
VPFTPHDPEEEPSRVRAPSPSFDPKPASFLRLFLMPRPHPSAHGGHPTYPWYNVLWLTGVDYFSTLGYQPGIALLAAGALAPVATLVLVLVTLLGALPIYAQVAGRSFAGQGSIAMLERLLPGWYGKVFVLALLGFASTDFVITMTLSAADAAQHAVENPILHPLIGEHRIAVTCLLLGLLAAVFLRGFTEAIGVAAFICVPYLLLNAVVVGRGLLQVLTHPELLRGWKAALSLRGDAGAILFASILVFPRLALGMSGFETGVSVMPLVRGAGPEERIRSTRKLLGAAAAIMSVLLLGSSLATAVLIPLEELKPGGHASGRALAYLAHELLGNGFGSVYDACTVAILWFAGASAMAGMLNLLPRYLPRFGMAPRWAEHNRPLVLVLLVIDLAVTLVFRADVDAQGGAYATGVLALMLSAGVAVALSLWQEAKQGQARRRTSLAFWLISGVFAYTLVDNVIERPDGLIISALFILAILLVSAASRVLRSAELRVETMVFSSPESERLWNELKDKKANLVPLREASAAARAEKAQQIRRHYRASGRIAFVQVALADDRSDFAGSLRVSVDPEGEDLVLRIDGAVSIANALAWVSEQLDPIALYLDLSLGNQVTQALKFLRWGEGEIGVMVYQILVSYWRSTPEDDVRPYIFLVSR